MSAICASAMFGARRIRFTAPDYAGAPNGAVQCCPGDMLRDLDLGSSGSIGLRSRKTPPNFLGTGTHPYVSNVRLIRLIDGCSIDSSFVVIGGMRHALARVIDTASLREGAVPQASGVGTTSTRNSGKSGPATGLPGVTEFGAPEITVFCSGTVPERGS